MWYQLGKEGKEGVRGVDGSVFWLPRPCRTLMVFRNSQMEREQA